MSRPPDVRNADIVDATVLAHTASSIDRAYAGNELPRLQQAGVADESSINAHLTFGRFESSPTVSGRLQGRLQLVCQRCMEAMGFELDEDFQVVIVEQERADEPGGFEPVIASASRLDVRWLVEDQTLLALPLVPMHEAEHCPGPMSSAEHAPPQTDEIDDDVRQAPFKNLRDMLRKR